MTATATRLMIGVGLGLVTALATSPVWLLALYLSGVLQ